MRYRRGWNGMTEIAWEDVMPTDGTAAVAAEASRKAADRANTIKVYTFTPRVENDRVAHKRAVRKRRKRVRIYRLALQGVSASLMLTQIAMVDGANMLQTLALVCGIIGCAGILLILDMAERNEP